MDSASEQKLAGVNPALAAAVRSMAASVAARGGSLRVVSGFRTYAEQAALYANRANNSNPVAVPGTSLHEKGLAVDLTWSGVSQSYVGILGEGLGLRWGGRFSRPDPGHFELPGGVPESYDTPAEAYDRQEGAALSLAGLSEYASANAGTIAVGGFALLILILLLRR